MRIGGVKPDAVITSDAMREAVAAHNARSDRKLVRDHGPAARLPLTGELTMQIVDQEVDALDAHDLTRAEVAARAQAWDYLDAFRRAHRGLGGRLPGGNRAADRDPGVAPCRESLCGHRR